MVSTLNTNTLLSGLILAVAVTKIHVAQIPLNAKWEKLSVTQTR